MTRTSLTGQHRVQGGVQWCSGPERHRTSWAWALRTFFAGTTKYGVLPLNAAFSLCWFRWPQRSTDVSTPKWGVRCHSFQPYRRFGAIRPHRHSTRHRIRRSGQIAFDMMVRWQRDYNSLPRASAPSFISPYPRALVGRSFPFGI